RVSRQRLQFVAHVRCQSAAVSWLLLVNDAPRSVDDAHLDYRLDGAYGDASAGIVRHDEDVARRETQVSGSALGNLLDVDVEVGSRVRAGRAAQDPRLLRIRRSEHPARGCEGLQDGHRLPGA